MSIVVSGMRPTGRLHLGHLEGVIRNWLRLQETEHCFFFVADIHALTDRNAPEDISLWTTEMVRDWLALGIDPKKATIFVQSHLPEHCVLATLLGMVTPVGALERSPTYKDRTSELGEGSENLGLLSYPVLMAADVALYGGEKIPVGQDQVSHLELTREIIRKFNMRFPHAELIEPQPLLTEAPKLMGTDGRKMSKSYDNAIEIFGDESATRKRIMSIVTDSQPVEAPKQNLENNIPLQLLNFIAPDRAVEVEAKLAAGGYGYGEAKKELFSAFMNSMAPMREKREKLSEVEKILADGAERARAAARPVIDRVLNAVGFIR